VTPQEKLLELKHSAAELQERAILRALEIFDVVIECVPKRVDAKARAVASLPGAEFVMTVSAKELSVDVRAGDRSETVFRRCFDAPTTFGSEAA
jgi:hypothetical protein